MCSIVVDTYNYTYKLSNKFGFCFRSLFFPEITPIMARFPVGLPKQNLLVLLVSDFYRLHVLPVTQPAVSKG